jgi:hypothetical protein
MYIQVARINADVQGTMWNYGKGASIKQLFPRLLLRTAFDAIFTLGTEPQGTCCDLQGTLCFVCIQGRHLECEALT